MNSNNLPGSLLERYLLLIEISRELASTLDLDVLLDSIVFAAANVTDSKAASILLYDESKHELYFQASTNIESPLMRGLIVPVEGSIAGEIVTTREPKVQTASDAPRHFDKIGEEVEFHTDTLLGVPLITKDKVIGVLEALNKIDGDFTQEDQELLLALGSQAAIAIENSRLFQQSDLISEMVHELRTPLASIGTAAHLLMRPEISSDQRKSMAETIQRETNRLSEMASSFLDLAKLESGRGQFKVERVDLKQILEEASEVMMSQLEDKGLTFEWQVEEPLPEFNGDPDKLKQVAINLISNAIKYNRPNGAITLGAYNEKENVVFFVQDSGRGMLPEHVESLFEKFYRVPGSEKVAQGTGLGLSIVKKIVESHGGEIIVKSQVGEGTTFEICIPLNS